MIRVLLFLNTIKLKLVQVKYSCILFPFTRTLDVGVKAELQKINSKRLMVTSHDNIRRIFMIITTTIQKYHTSFIHTHINTYNYTHTETHL